ncbi:MAG: acyltransferase [Xanthomonadaceae bacterium]|nr:acyltransferase [Xanthomonadaceae bacterium]
MKGQPFIPALHGLRGIAALAVFLFHWNGFFPALNIEYRSINALGLEWHPFRLIHFGWLGVSLFFILSGYLLGGQLKQKTLDFRTLSVYWSRRFLRIYPAVWFQMSLLLALAALVAEVSVPALSWAELLHNLALWIHLPPWMTRPVNGMWWTLPVELSFYIVLPAIILLQRRIGWPAVVLIGLAITFSWRAWMMSIYDGEHYARYIPVIDALPGSLSAFVAGFALSFLTPSWGLARCTISLLIAIALFTSLQNVLVINAEAYWTGHWLFIVWKPAMELVLALMMFILLHDTVLSRPLSSRVLVWLGEISFGIYLWHFPVQQYLNTVYGEAWNTPLGSLLALVTSLTATLILAAVSFYAIERPVMGWGKRLNTTRPPA